MSAFTVDGIDRFEEALKGIVGAERRAIVKDALKPAAEMVRDEIQGRANFGPYSRGKLRNSIGVEETQISGEPSVIVRPDRRKGKGGRHAHLVEFPVAPHESKYYGRKAQHPGTKGQPFFNPGVAAKADQALDLMERAMLDAASAHWEKSGGGQA